MPMPRQRLFNMEIDEVSLVDRAANQHSTVAIAKRDTGDTVNFVDKDGTPVAEDEANAGDYLYDSETGEEYYIADDQEVEELRAAGELEEQDEPDYAGAFGKADWAGLKDGAKEWRKAGSMTQRAGRAARNAPGRVQRMGTRPFTMSGREVAQNGVAAAGAGALADKTLSKRDDSLGQYVLAELSKAHADERVTGVVGQIAKAYDEVTAQNDELRQAVSALIEKSDRESYTAVADSYGLPVRSDELGGLLQRLAYAGASDDDLGLLGGILGQAGQMSKALEELGETGGYEAGSILSEVESYADGMIAKSNGGMTREQAMVELFSANDEAYSAYLAE